MSIAETVKKIIMGGKEEEVKYKSEYHYERKGETQEKVQKEKEGPQEELQRRRLTTQDQQEQQEIAKTVEETESLAKELGQKEKN